MKIVEALKKIKENKRKIDDLRTKISQHCAHLDYETPMYADAKERVQSWAQSCEDLNQENIRLHDAIQRTNLATDVSIDFGDKTVTKKISEWIWRRREYAQADLRIWSAMTDRGLKEGTVQTSTGVEKKIQIVRCYDPILRDKKMAEYVSEPNLINAKLEVVNAITDLIE